MAGFAEPRAKKTIKISTVCKINPKCNTWKPQKALFIRLAQHAYLTSSLMKSARRQDGMECDVRTSHCMCNFISLWSFVIRHNVVILTGNLKKITDISELMKARDLTSPCSRIAIVDYSAMHAWACLGWASMDARTRHGMWPADSGTRLQRSFSDTASLYRSVGLQTTNFRRVLMYLVLCIGWWSKSIVCCCFHHLQSFYGPRASHAFWWYDSPIHCVLRVFSTGNILHWQWLIQQTHFEVLYVEASSSCTSKHTTCYVGLIFVNNRRAANTPQDCLVVGDPQANKNSTQFLFLKFAWSFSLFHIINAYRTKLSLIHLNSTSSTKKIHRQWLRPSVNPPPPTSFVVLGAC